MKIKNVKMIELSDWDDLVQKTYGRPYKFQQQDGCKGRGVVNITVPCEDAEDSDFENDEVPEVVNGDVQGVSFAAWLERDPKKPIDEQEYDWELEMWWQRNFYPHVEMIVNDLHKRGLLEAGKYSINIDW